MQLRVLFQLSLQCSSSSRNVNFFFFLINFGKWFGLGFCFVFQHSQLLFYSFTVCITVGFEAFAVSGTTVVYGQLGCPAGSN